MGDTTVRMTADDIIRKPHALIALMILLSLHNITKIKNKSINYYVESEMENKIVVLKCHAVVYTWAASLARIIERLVSSIN